MYTDKILLMFVKLVVKYKQVRSWVYNGAERPTEIKTLIDYWEKLSF